MKIETRLKLFEWRLKFQLLWMNKIRPNKKKIAIVGGIAVAGLAALIWFHNYGIDHSRYYYIDTQGNKGVATGCYSTDSALFCKRQYGGKIKVIEYWKGE